MSFEKSLVIIPVLNEAPRIAILLQKLRQCGFKHIVVVDDGSTDQIEKEIYDSKVKILTHCQNCGVGAATQTGIVWGIKQGFDLFFTIDGDGQQNPEDLVKIRNNLEEHECVIGSRFLEKNKIPFFRRVANKIANVLTGIFFGVWVSDSQSGLRGFSLKVAQKLTLHANGFEYCSEFIREVNHAGFEIFEVPISVKYTTETLAKGQNFSEGIKTFGKLFLRALSR
ncbi:glycosyltransferase family 2 protein [Candidatus Gracilibacteria bacterium]|nr:glycosyltransferase family 2 protein [Candidatus Gracilibacteria bacterium]